MRTPLGTLVIRYRTRLAACQRPYAGHCALAAVAMSVALPMAAAAQRADGAIGVSLVIAPMVEIRTVAITELRLDRDGIASIMPTRPDGSPVKGRAMPHAPASISRTAPLEVRVRRQLLVVAGT